MKFICTQENLVRGLGRVVPVAGKNKQLQILNNILLELREGVLHLTATDLELGVHSIVLGKVEDEGSCTVPARKLMDYVQQLPNAEPVTIETKDSVLWVKTKGFQAQFPTVGDEDFPILPRPQGEVEIELGGDQLCQGLTQTIFAAARDETRPEIHSVYVRGEGANLIIASTDSFRLVEKIVPLSSEVLEFSILLPLATAQEVVRLFSDQDRVKLVPSDSHILFVSDNVELFSRLVDGKYPDYRQIIPTSFSTEGTVRRSELVRALKTLMVFLPRDSRRVKMTVQPSKGAVALVVGGGDSGEGDVELDFDGNGGDLEVMFNIQYLLDGAQSIDGEDVLIKFVGANNASVFTPKGDKDQFTYVVMPIQV